MAYLEWTALICLLCLCDTVSMAFTFEKIMMLACLFPRNVKQLF